MGGKEDRPSPDSKAGGKGPRPTSEERKLSIADTAPGGRASTPAPTADVDELLAGVALAEEVRLQRERELASGGMGYIDAVADNSLMRHLARKVLHDRLQGDARVVGMFIREAQLTGQLAHPNIVPVHELGVDDEDHLFFTMKLIEGRTLAELIDRLPPGPIEHGRLMQMVDILVKVCDALAFAHSRGVIHCDIKTENVMVGDFGQVYLMDWGLARVVEGGEARTSVGSHSDKGQFMGTPGYMSPEQANADNENLDARTDVFGVGTLLYELIKRHPPFAAESPWEAIAAAQDCNYPPLVEPEQFLPVPRTLMRVTERALAKAPEERYQSAADLKNALLHFMHGGGEFPMVRLFGGAHVVREGEPGGTAYIIVSGRCEVYKTVDGRRVTLRTMGPGEVFGETAILSPGPRTASVVALDDVTLHILTADVFEAEIESMKPWMGSFVHSLATRFRESEAARPLATLRARPTQVAEYLLMRLLTWGRVADDGAVEAYWSHSRSTLSELFGTDADRIESMLAEFREIEIRTDADLVRVAHPDSLKRAIRARLHREAGD